MRGHDRAADRAADGLAAGPDADVQHGIAGADRGASTFTRGDRATQRGRAVTGGHATADAHTSTASDAPPVTVRYRLGHTKPVAERVIFAVAYPDRGGRRGGVSVTYADSGANTRTNSRADSGTDPGPNTRADTDTNPRTDTYAGADSHALLAAGQPTARQALPARPHQAATGGEAVNGHPAQLRICHERIAAARQVHDSARPEPWQYCSLGAQAWCFDCSYYVCDIHAIARHEQHRIEVES